MKNLKFVPKTHSTNTLLWELLRSEQLPEGFVVHTDFQTAGKGQIGNSWESEARRNLLFSMVLYPQRIPLDQLFLISQIVSLGICKTLQKYTTEVVVKWPNDIYWQDKKLAGILIENQFQANKVKTIVGVGLNVNQCCFVSNAPNPVSLRQIIAKSVNRNQLLESICRYILELYAEMNVEKIRAEYAQLLYRKDGYHLYKSDNGQFRAKILVVQPDGQLCLETEAGERKEFYFKEVQFIL